MFYDFQRTPHRYLWYCTTPYAIVIFYSSLFIYTFAIYLLHLFCSANRAHIWCLPLEPNIVLWVITYGQLPLIWCTIECHQIWLMCYLLSITICYYYALFNYFNILYSFAQCLLYSVQLYLPPSNIPGIHLYCKYVSRYIRMFVHIFIIRVI